MKTETKAEAQPEKVLVFPASLLKGELAFEGLTSSRKAIAHFIELCADPKNLQWADRDKAEKDPTLKQVIPYSVIFVGREVLVYERGKSGGEDRLHGLLSLGVGGHVNPVDLNWSGKVDYTIAARRELAEEVGPVKNYIESDEIAGLIYDSSTEVGRVHFGVVHHVRFPLNTPFAFNDPALKSSRFIHVSELRSMVTCFESWSKLIIKELV